MTRSVNRNKACTCCPRTCVPPYLSCNKNTPLASDSSNQAKLCHQTLSAITFVPYIIKRQRVNRISLTIDKPCRRMWKTIYMLLGFSCINWTWCFARKCTSALNSVQACSSVYWDNNGIEMLTSIEIMATLLQVIPQCASHLWHRIEKEHLMSGTDLRLINSCR